MPSLHNRLTGHFRKMNQRSRRMCIDPSPPIQTRCTFRGILLIRQKRLKGRPVRGGGGGYVKVSVIVAAVSYEIGRT
eukprot:scaffold124253_cov42-Cyclotella_meneghiniana.AAC.3